MEIVDANILLRYLLKDHDEMHKAAKSIIEDRNVFIPNEVVAETVYVLEKVYDIPRLKIRSAINILLDYKNLDLTSKDLLREALSLYSTRKLDFVDSILLAQNHVYKHTIHTFDKKLKGLLKT